MVNWKRVTARKLKKRVKMRQTRMMIEQLYVRVDSQERKVSN